MDNSRDEDRMGAAAAALNRTVDSLSVEDLQAPSLLPGWSRAHVVAHLALNGHAMAAVLDGVARGETPAMYESDEQRDADIAELAEADPAELRDQLLAATTAFSDALAAVDEERWAGSFTRLPGSPPWPADAIVATRRRELEIHHADLGSSYTHRDWPEDFARELLDVASVDQAGSGPFLVRATDLGADWVVGEEGGPVVTGGGADLGWWLTGRGAGAGLSCDAGQLPALGPWRRATGTAGS